MIKILIPFLKFWRSFASIIAPLCLIFWLSRVFCADFFYSLIKFMKNFIKLVQSAPIGFIYASIALCISIFAAIKLLKKLERLEKIQDSEEIEKRLKTKQAIKKAKEKAKKAKFIDIKEFYGLFEFNFEAYNMCEELKTLKNKYCRMIKEKIQDKYPQADFLVSDKIFFITPDFSLLNSITNDLVMLFNILKNVNEQKELETSMLLSFYGDSQKTSHQTALKILNEINELEYKNKIIISQDIYVKYQQEVQNCPEFIPLGASKLNSLNNKNKNLELYSKSF